MFRIPKNNIAVRDLVLFRTSNIQPPAASIVAEWLFCLRFFSPTTDSKASNSNSAFFVSFFKSPCVLVLPTHHLLQPPLFPHPLVKGKLLDLPMFPTLIVVAT
ncbi:hypothetical protein Acr_00g0098340 [Actinidia rufa]|uniref:Uncharacterized protein n=1 Tax=Actinidia rufa TaxID=165716 RepID=A0A7J0E123_9ERIC|nr:hypothetical protein Acr_00g0098340 [Actinidia rufa]